MIEDFSEEEKEILTAEAVEQLAAKHAELAIEDFGPYLDLSPLQEEGSLWETLEFDYEGQTLWLRVSASDKELAAAPYEGALDGAVVFREDFLELDSAEEEYAYDGSCADIRSGNLGTYSGWKRGDVRLSDSDASGRIEAERFQILDGQPRRRCIFERRGGRRRADIGKCRFLCRKTTGGRH